MQVNRFNQQFDEHLMKRDDRLISSAYYRAAIADDINASRFFALWYLTLDSHGVLGRNSGVLTKFYSDQIVSVGVVCFPNQCLHRSGAGWAAGGRP